jgi:hypothetical protein
VILLHFRRGTQSECALTPPANKPRDGHTCAADHPAQIAVCELSHNESKPYLGCSSASNDTLMRGAGVTPPANLRRKKVTSTYIQAGS